MVLSNPSNPAVLVEWVEEWANQSVSKQYSLMVAKRQSLRKPQLIEMAINVQKYLNHTITLSLENKYRTNILRMEILVEVNNSNINKLVKET